MRTIIIVMLSVAAGCGTYMPPGYEAHIDHTQPFNPYSGVESEHDRPCELAEYVGGPKVLQPGWHACQMQEGPAACCPDGWSCDGDDFVPHRLQPGETHMCRAGGPQTWRSQ